ncbi:hypothetical protein C1645_742535 [Glomus cerebriforme]|uniref:Galactose oxidase n=1 Tax=Glomus cerebriforme TaxID=658196 RepID=A0A397SD10_9GLOM|nr:hypothetical protein C1645_742535 [Glomus cerebriforme]
MLQKYLTYIILWILFQLTVEINCQMNPIQPRQRSFHTASVNGDKLFILGGGSNVKGVIVGKDFFYLNVSVVFNTQNLLWGDLSSNNFLSPHFGAASAVGGEYDNTTFIYGGVTGDPTMDLVNSFDSDGFSGFIDKIARTNTNIRKAFLTGIMDRNEKMYLWGGAEVINGKAANYVNDMLIFDTVNLMWGKGSVVGAPTPRINYGAVLLPNNNIIYTGGYDGKELALNQVYIYDTINDSWDIKATSGKIPSNRDGFSAVLGDGYDQLTESDILLLDIRNNEEYLWTNQFVPPTVLPSPTPSGTQLSTLPTSLTLSPAPMQQSNNKSTPVISIVVESLFGCVILSLGCFFLYRWNKTKPKQKDTSIISEH